MIKTYLAPQIQSSAKPKAELIQARFNLMSHFEFWPYWLFYIPVYFYYFILAIKAKSFSFPTTTNPAIPHSGCVSESKKEIQEMLPAELMPETLFLDSSDSFYRINQKLKNTNLSFPMIAKPDSGERGKGVRILHSLKDLKEYAEESEGDFHLQEFIDGEEFGVFVVQRPNQKPFISSITQKSFLKVKGDGKLTLKKLVAIHPRHSRLLDQLIEIYPKHPWNQVISLGEEFLIEPVGNHSRGTIFLDANHLKTLENSEFFASILENLDGVYYGRFDIKCPSIEAFKKGEDIKVLELNGLFAEPAHIYHPGSSLIKAYQTLFQHWDWIFEISEDQYRHHKAKRSSLLEVLRLFGGYFFSDPALDQDQNNDQADYYKPLIRP